MLSMLLKQRNKLYYQGLKNQIFVQGEVDYIFDAGFEGKPQNSAQLAKERLKALFQQK